MSTPKFTPGPWKELIGCAAFCDELAADLAAVAQRLPIPPPRTPGVSRAPSDRGVIERAVAGVVGTAAWLRDEAAYVDESTNPSESE